MTENDKKILHFTFGPVQGFVAQARRTRDLWAGSYLISYLAGCAMKAAKDGGGEIVMPEANKDPLFNALFLGSKPAKASDPAAQIGSLPNRFKAEVPKNFSGHQCADAIREKWKHIADAVKAKAGSLGIALDPDIWDRQVSGFWDCTWAFGDDDTLLDRRKNLRSHEIASEPGEKCTLCGERQEMSGLGMTGKGAGRQAMQDWWKEVRKNFGKEIRKATLFDLKENERLCAVCLVKRAFPFPDIAEDEKAIGWGVPVNYPSTAYMAAVDWLIAVLEECKNSGPVREAVKNFVVAARAADVHLSGAATRIDGITKAGSASDLEKQDWEYLADLDGGAFFESVVENEKEFDVKEDPAVPRANRNALLGALKALHKELGRVRATYSKSADGVPLPAKATPFYAHLLMDGDNMGKLLSDHKEQQRDISEALAAFIKAVPGIVQGCNGRLIYAGGDDVFALLPIDTAIECARACRQAFVKAFDGRGLNKRGEFTISAAIEYAHIHSSLGMVVRDAHELLDRHAKDGCNRDGLACRVWKRGGPVLAWAQPWEVVASGTGSNLVEKVMTMFQHNSKNPDRFSSKFFYKARKLFEILDPPGGTPLANGAQELLVAEYLATREHHWDPNWDKSKIETEAKKRIEQFLQLCRAHRRNTGGGLQDGRLTADGALLVRFLSQKRV